MNQRLYIPCANKFAGFFTIICSAAYTYLLTPFVKDLYYVVFLEVAIYFDDSD